VGHALSYPTNRRFAVVLLSLHILCKPRRFHAAQKLKADRGELARSALYYYPSIFFARRDDSMLLKS
jgi:hypothetical protein